MNEKRIEGVDEKVLFILEAPQLGRREDLILEKYLNVLIFFKLEGF